ncbi:hypothetical protein STEG23_017598 [Scotinomys teguina]
MLLLRGSMLPPSRYDVRWSYYQGPCLGPWSCCSWDFSLILLIKGGALSGTDSYQSLVNKTFGFPGYLLLSALQFMYPFIDLPPFYNFNNSNSWNCNDKGSFLGVKYFTLFDLGHDPFS